MPVYTIEQLTALKSSDLVAVPEFEWNEIEKVSPSAQREQQAAGGAWRRSSHNNQKRPVVMPKAAIPFSQRALFDKKAEGGESAVEEGGDAEGDSDAGDDEYAARFLLKNKAATRKVPETTEDGAPVINLSYAAALAASMKMSEAASTEQQQQQPEEAAADDEDGWVSVSHQQKPRRNRNKGSFSKWR